jgi:hypothetical protein
MNGVNVYESCRFMWVTHPIVDDLTGKQQKKPATGRPEPQRLAEAARACTTAS